MDETEHELIEALAAKEHESWARWQMYLHSLCERREDGALIIPASRVAFWSWEAATAYEQLPDQLKQYDRDEVAHILPIIHDYAQARQSSEPASLADSQFLAACRGEAVVGWAKCGDELWHYFSAPGTLSLCGDWYHWTERDPARHVGATGTCARCEQVKARGDVRT